MTMTDEELDRDWQPNGRRPQSTIARSFSQELMDIFRIENSLTDLDQSVVERKQTVNRGNEELASLEARIREMEDRLKAQQGLKGNNTTPAQHKQQQQQLQALRDDAEMARSRPGTAVPPTNQQQSSSGTQQNAPNSGLMPSTSSPSEGEFHVVTRADYT